MANTIALLMFLGIVPGFSFGFLCHHRRRLSWKSFWGIVIASTGPFWFYVFGQNDPMGAASWTIFFQYLSWMIIFILGYLGMGLFVQPKKQH